MLVRDLLKETFPHTLAILGLDLEVILIQASYTYGDLPGCHSGFLVFSQMFYFVQETSLHQV